MLIRALTIFINDYSKISEYSDKLSRINEDYIWSKRLSLPPTPKNISLSKLVDFLPSKDKNIMFSLIALDNSDNRIGEIKDILKTDNRIFAHVLVRDIKNIESVARFLISLEPDEATRFALLYNFEFLTTPYFPTSTANTVYDSFGLSLLYVNDFKNGKIDFALQKANEIGKEFQKRLGIKFLGIDASLSPWMNESVAEIIEANSGKIFNIANLWYIGEINQKILESTWRNRVSPIGFSELMLPIAEDNILRERVKEGSLTLKDILLMSYFCVAGIDMVGVYSNLSIYENLLKDIYYIQHVKRRPYGVRLIPTHGNPVLSNMFGEIPDVKIV
ncbi:DUF711 domain-containing protein [Sulfolobus sp. A20-N-G8]|nr:DUF711 domain-containing protein [Sulfolobus sp. A20-N-G8]